MINLHFGGEVVPNGKNRSHVGTVHDLIWRAPFDSYEGRPDRVNSFHDLIVKPEGLASCLDIAALSLEDGNVEGAAHQEIPVFCIQWHPERPQPSGAQFEMGLIERMVRGGNFWT